MIIPIGGTIHPLVYLALVMGVISTILGFVFMFINPISLLFVVAGIGALIWAFTSGGG